MGSGRKTGSTSCSQWACLDSEVVAPAAVVYLTTAPSEGRSRSQQAPPAPATSPFSSMESACSFFKPLLNLCPFNFQVPSHLPSTPHWTMSRPPLHRDFIALDRAHQVVMQQLALEQAAAWDESLSEEERQKILATVEEKLQAHMIEFRAEWERVEARIERETEGSRSQ